MLSSDKQDDLSHSHVTSSNVLNDSHITVISEDKNQNQAVQSCDERNFFNQLQIFTIVNLNISTCIETLDIFDILIVIHVSDHVKKFQ